MLTIDHLKALRKLAMEGDPNFKPPTPFHHLVCPKMEKIDE